MKRSLHIGLLALLLLALLAGCAPAATPLRRIPTVGECAASLRERIRRLRPPRPEVRGQADLRRQRQFELVGSQGTGF